MLMTDETCCCAVDQIDGLDGYRSKPEEAMFQFCKNVFREKNYWDLQDKDYLQPFYIFTGVEGCKGRKAKDNVVRDEDGYRMPLKYASEFASFIRKNKLGKVATLPPRYNVNNHPTHSVKVWIWSTDKRALKAWYNKNKTKLKDINIRRNDWDDSEQDDWGL